MKTHFRECRRAKSAAVAALFCAALASTSLVRGQYTYVTSFGTPGTGTGDLESPVGVAVSSTGSVYVADQGNSRIEAFNSNGGNPNTFLNLPFYDNPSAVAVAPNGNVYVGFNELGTFNGSVDEFYSNGGAGPSIVVYPFLPVTGVAVNASGNIFVASDTNQIDVFNSSGGNGNPATIGSYGSGNGEMTYPTGVAVGAAGNIYVADYGNNRIDVFTATGGIGTPASFAATCGSASGVAVGATGNVYVADSANNCIDVFSSSGQPVTSFGSSGSGIGQFNDPTGIAVSPTGEIFVADTGNNRIVKYFDPAEWVSGSPHFSTAAVGYGQLLGQSLTMNASQGLLVDGALTIQAGGSLTTLGGNVSAGSFTNSGTYSAGGGTVTVGIGQGTLLNNATMTLNGAVVAAALTNYYGANLTAQGTVQGNLLNQGTLTQSGVLSVNGNFTNSAVVLLSAGGAVSGAGNFTNQASGTIRGDGAITMPLSNQGLIYATGGNGLTLTNFAFNGNMSGSELRVADGDSLTVLASPFFENNSLITLQGPNSVFSGSTFYNNGTLSGQGRVTNTVNNYQTISAVGGQLALAGASIYNSGTIQSAAGTSILVSQGLGSNYGQIALTGGAFNNDANPMTNYGSILGNGAFSTGGSGLANNDLVTFSDGNSSIFGAVANNSGGTISTYGTSAATTLIDFYGAVTDNPGAVFQINSSTVRFLGGFAGNAPVIVDPAVVYFSGLTLGTSGVLQGGAGDQFFVTAPFTNAGQIDLAANSTMLVENGGTLTQTAGVLHLGGSATLTAGAVEIDGGTLLADGPGGTITASLVYGSPAATTYQGLLAGGGNSLTVDNPAALLVLSGTGNSFTGGTYVEAGTLEVTNYGAVPSGTNLIVGADGSSIFGEVAVAQTATPVPEPSTLALVIAGVAAFAGYRLRGRKVPQSPSWRFAEMPFHCAERDERVGERTSGEMN